MERKKLYLIILTSGLLLIMPFQLSHSARILSYDSNADSAITWETDLNSALNKAAASNKPIVLDLYTDWCHWCKVLDEQVWINEDVISFSRGQIYLKLNAEKTIDGRRLARKFGVRGFPTVIILNHKEEEIGKIIGYYPADQYLRKLKSIVSQ